jgi:hypothetical protein
MFQTQLLPELGSYLVATLPHLQRDDLPAMHTTRVSQPRPLAVSAILPRATVWPSGCAMR